ncbi:ATP-binding protein [Segatella copri]|uniref:ATP-binding protein n=1 Tax=Segatella copri TaxID=165179 RepID=UPI0025D31FC2|nr:ATP-binding protein [Segatella copri]
MRTIINNQKKERDILLSRPYLTRHTQYDVDELLASKQIKLITGPRRTGKSTEALLMLKSRNFAYLNFDDGKLLSAWDDDLVWETLRAVYPDFEYLLLDEVQNLDGWDLWVSKLYRMGINMVITGSNAKLLSSEMATLLTGRYIQIEMLPFSLSEFFIWNHRNLSEVSEMKDSASDLSLIADYLHHGGYPETVAARSLTQNYLSTLFDSIIWKDIAKRHKVRNVEDLNNLAMYLVSNFCNPFSANELAEALGFSSVATTKKFMGYLREPYLLYYLPRYNNKLKVMKKAPQKVYVVDNGFVEAKVFNVSENLGRLLENQVFIELVRRGYHAETSLFYYRSRNDKETDFVTRQGAHVESLIQVCYDLSSERTLKREVDSIIECAGELKCSNLTIVTMNEERVIEKNGYKVKVLPIYKF